MFKTGIFGPSWRSTYEERVFLGSDGFMKYARADGSFWSFGFQGYGSGNQTFIYQVAAPANENSTLTNSATAWTVTFKNGEQRVFDSESGNLLSITDRNGNVTQVSYDGSGRLSVVTDPAGRHMTFTYSGTNNLVTSVSSDVGVSLSYTYDQQGRLNQVTKPDSTTTSFEYDANSMITAVKDSDGKILESHTYDSHGRGLSSSRANGVESVSVSY